MTSSTLAVRNVTFRYRGSSEELFGGITHAFTRGSITALTGPSGRGKSTLLHILGLLRSPTAGSVLLDGAPVSALNDLTRSGLRASRIGFVFQDSELDPARKVIDSVVEPALYAGRRRSEVLPHAYALLDELGLAERANHRPGQVSGGQAQRLAVCRALVNEPDVVLADEPTGNLDRDNAGLVLDALTRTARLRFDTVVIATHDPFILDRVDEVIAL